jgi:replicative DNA helicase
MIKRREVNNTIEERILVGLIVSDKFCRDIFHILKPEYFVVPYVKIVVRWCIEYYNQYKLAPQAHIQDIFTTEQTKLKEEDATIISSFLERLSEQFEQEESLNVDYLLDKAFLYFKRKALELTAERITSNLELNNIEKAEEELKNFKSVSKEMSPFTDPMTEAAVKKYIANLQDRSNILFRLPGALGNMIGDFKRDTLLGVLSPAKRGKTFWLLEIAIQAYLEGKKVLFVSLEMSEDQILGRFYKRLTALGDTSKEYIYPAFDCKKNQDNTCRKKDRTCKVGLLVGDKKPLQENFDFSKSDYEICIACRGKKDFAVGNWFTTMKRDKSTTRILTRQIKALGKIYKDNFRLISYPSFSANVPKIKWHLADLEESFGFVPDVICIDYADILAPEDTRQVGRERLDETWKMLKNLADTKHCLVATASQSNRGSFSKRSVTQVDIAEDIRKVAHVNYMISLNQTPEEKNESVIRVGLIAERDGMFDEYKHALVLQQLTLGQVCLDSEIVKIYKKDTNQDEE